MKTLTLIEMVRKTRENGHRYCAVDHDERVYSYEPQEKPEPEFESGVFQTDSQYKVIGNFNLNKTDWQDALIDVEKIKVK